MRSAWTQAAIIILLAGGVVFWGVREINKPLGRDELKIEVADLRSHASEGRKLADQSSPDKTTRAYFEAQTLLLVDKAQEVKKQLDDTNPESGLEVQQGQARHLAGQVKTNLEQLSTSFAQPYEANKVKDELGTLYPQLSELEESLKR
jgi:hypothetical protein